MLLDEPLYKWRAASFTCGIGAQPTMIIHNVDGVAPALPVPAPDPFHQSRPYGGEQHGGDTVPQPDRPQRFADVVEQPGLEDIPVLVACGKEPSRHLERVLLVVQWHPEE